MSCSAVRLLTTLVFTAAMGSSASAWAVACTTGTSAFTDVPDTASFCTNAQWLKNRAVTVGCGDGTTFCPDETVIRGSMALFMNRLGTALTPTFYSGGPVDFGGFGLTPSGLSQCATFIVAAASYPRTGTVDGWVSLGNPSTAITAYAAAVVRFNGGAYVPSGAYGFAGLPTTSSAASIPAVGSWTIPAGQTAQFAIFISEAGAAGGATVGMGRCGLIARVDNFNSPTAPF